MSVAALRRTEVPPRLRQLAIAAAALLLVGGASALLLWLVAPATAPAPPRNPFGIGVREAAPAAGGLGAQLLAWQAAFFVRLRGALAAVSADGAAWPALLGLGFAYGVFHAAGPGHGKAVVAGYIVASERALRRGLAVSTAAAAIQALVAIGLVGAVFALLGGAAALMSRTTQIVELAGFGLVAALGAHLLWRKAAAFAAGLDPTSGEATGPACDGCGPLRAPLREGGGWREAATVALAAGCRPCAGALVVLTFALAQGQMPAGIAAVLAMAAGTALTTGALAALAVYGKRLALRLAGGGRNRTGRLLGAGAELAAAAFVLVVGIALLSGAWSAGA